MAQTEMQNTTDQAIKRTFDVLVERISNIEETIQPLYSGAVFDECCKYGRLNQRVLDHPFSISRNPQCSAFPGEPHPTMSCVIVDLPDMGDCSCHEKPRAWTIEVIS